MKNTQKISIGLLMLTSIVMLSACQKTEDTPTHAAAPTSGSVSGAISVDKIASLVQGIGRRSAALLGVFVTEYVSVAPAATAAEGGLKGIGVQMQIAIAQNTVQDPDFDLLQALADAVQVDVPDLLNRSTDREQTLAVYSEALRNVAQRSNDRYKELAATYKELKDQLRTLGKNRSDAERALKNAIKDKDFEGAGEKQRLVNEAQAAYAETDLHRKQVEDILSTFEKLLTIYGQKIQAMEANREVLISGARVVDVPGIDELQLIRHQKTVTPSGKNGTSFDGLFAP